MDPLFLIAGLFAGGALVQWVAARLRLPAIVLLLAAGILAGPVTGLLRPEEAFGDLLRPLIGLSVALILFEGGLSLRFSEAKRLGAPLWALVVGGLLLSFVSVSAAAYYLAGTSWATSCVLGAILIVTGPTVVKPLLRQARIARRPALLLKWESIVNDPLGALLAVVVTEIAVTGGRDLAHVPALIGVAGAIGLAGGLLFGYALRHGAIPEHLKTPCSVGGGMAVYAGAEAVFHEAGLLAVTITGLALANTRSSSVEDLRRFKEDIATILVAVLFLVLSAQLDFALEDLTAGVVLFVLAVLVVCRPLSGMGSLALTRLPWKEKLFVGWIAPRGVVAAAMGGALTPRLEEAGFEDARLLVPLLFAVILATVVAHGLTVRPLARALGLSSKGGGGLLLVGASNWAIDLASTLQRAGVDVVVVDTNYRNVSSARVLGLTAVHGDVRNEEILDAMPLERISWVLAATDDDHYNALVCMALVRLFGRERVLQLPPIEHPGEEDSHLNGRMVWSERATFGSLITAHWQGQSFKATALSEKEYDAAAFRAANPGALPLFMIGARGMAPVEDEDDLDVSEGKVVYLTGKETRA